MGTVYNQERMEIVRVPNIFRVLLKFTLAVLTLSRKSVNEVSKACHKANCKSFQNIIL